MDGISKHGEPDAGEGGAGAPPEIHEANRLPSDVMREYGSHEIRVQWYASRCIHSAACVRALPLVFDPRRRPWVDVSAADADAIADAVMLCPTGALHFTRPGTDSHRQAPETVSVRAVSDGPYMITGPVTVTDARGNVIREDTRMALCRCGQSKHLPFCDNTHRAIGFRSEIP
jgi:uncharacterized Fe-S cluster protein YjdI